MNYKSRLGIEVESSIFNQEVDQYFKNLGFYEDTMNPRFLNGDGYSELQLDKPCLRFDADWDEGGVQRVFMNKYELYVERQTNYRSFDSSGHVSFEEPPITVEKLETYLNSMVLP